MKAKVQLGDNVVTMVIDRITPGKKTKVRGHLIGCDETIIIELDDIIEYNFSENTEASIRDIVYSCCVFGSITVVAMLILHLVR